MNIDLAKNTLSRFGLDASGLTAEDLAAAPPEVRRSLETLAKAPVSGAPVIIVNVPAPVVNVPERLAAPAARGPSSRVEESELRRDENGRVTGSKTVVRYVYP